CTLALTGAAIAAVSLRAGKVAMAATRAAIAVTDTRSISSGALRLNEHAALHLHVHGMAEPRAVVPVNARLARGEGHRGRGLRGDLHVDTVIDDGEAVGQ